MLDVPHDLLEHFLDRGLLPVLFSITGLRLAFFLLARFMSEKRAPATRFAWLLVIVLLPSVGVPLFLRFGGRNLRKPAARNSRLLPQPPAGAVRPSIFASAQVAPTVMASGAAAPV